MSHPEVTISEETIHNPADARHFMRLKPVERRVRILRGGTVLAETDKALRLLEVGRDLYDPTLYIPEADVIAPLLRNAKASYCPIKGNAVYFDLAGDNGAVEVEEIAWAYPEPLDMAQELAGRIAFYGSHVTVEESPS